MFNPPPNFDKSKNLCSSDKERLAFLDHAWKIGCRVWDTAYSYGDSEETIGKWFRLHPERRGDIFLATKFGLKPDQNSEFGLSPDSSPEYARESLEQSLARLGVDCVDLYYMHRADPKVPIEETVTAMKQLKE